MALPPQPMPPVPNDTARLTRAAFPQGHRSRPMRAARGRLEEENRLVALCPRRGHPASAPWRLARVTGMTVVEGRSARPAAAAGRRRHAWKAAVSLERADPGLACSGRSEVRPRLLAGSQAHRRLGAKLPQGQARGGLKARGPQRTDATPGRAGLAGPGSHGVRALGRRRARSLGLAQTPLQPLALAAALPRVRVHAGCRGLPPASPRPARVAALRARVASPSSRRRRCMRHRDQPWPRAQIILQMTDEALIPVDNLQHNCYAHAGTKTHEKSAARLSAQVDMIPCGHSGKALRSSHVWCHEPVT